MAGRTKGTYAHRRREKALREKREEKMRKREQRKVDKAANPVDDGIADIVPGPQAIPWEEQGLEPLEAEPEDRGV